MGNGPSILFGQPASSRAASKCPPSGCEVRKRNLFESNVEEWDSTLVIVWVSFEMFLLMAGFICGRRRYRKIADIESKALHVAAKPPVEDGENIKSQTRIGAVEEAPLD
ncbi:hypothetical protein EDD85DRAFT_1018380 [Armillaria nabsnona]|nr:hypothetical protein EDD85DRAFT_1018380 [Armillaria nabsnona]